MAQRGIVKNTTSRSFGAAELSALVYGLTGSSGIVNIYSKLACTKISNNSIQVADGMYSITGHLVQVDMGTTETFAIGSGTTGYNRNDLVVAEYIKNGVSADNDVLQIRVVAGTPTTGTAADPTLTQEDINGNGATRQEALFRISIAGTTLTTITQIATVFNSTTQAAYFKSGVGASFPIGTTCTITDAFITAATVVSIYPTSAKIGTWTVNSYAGYFTITSTTTETTAVLFDWGAMK